MSLVLPLAQKVFLYWPNKIFDLILVLKVREHQSDKYVYQM